jgi:hypothetical protein
MQVFFNSVAMLKFNLQQVSVVTGVRSDRPTAGERPMLFIKFSFWGMFLQPKTVTDRRLFAFFPFTGSENSERAASMMLLCKLCISFSRKTICRKSP